MRVLSERDFIRIKNDAFMRGMDSGAKITNGLNSIVETVKDTVNEVIAKKKTEEKERDDKDEVLTDTKRLDFLQSKLGTFTGLVVCRMSSAGAGLKLHESARSDAVDDIRKAIDLFMMSEAMRKGENA